MERSRGFYEGRQGIDTAVNCVYDNYSATDEEFARILPPGTDIGFIDTVYDRGSQPALDTVFENLCFWSLQGMTMGGGHS